MIFKILILRFEALDWEICQLVTKLRPNRIPYLRRNIGTVKDKTKFLEIKITKPTHETHAHDTHAREMHAHKVHSYKVHACEIYASPKVHA